MMKYLVCLLLPFDFVMIPVVAVLAIFGRYPKWFITPDDPVSPFGLYEPAMRRAYYGTDQLPCVFRDGRVVVVGLGGVPLRPRGLRRWWGDFYWLGLRNRMYGFAYAFKPSCLMPGPDLTYRHLAGKARSWFGGYIGGGWVTEMHEVAGHRMWVIKLCNLFGHPFGIMFGYKVDTISKDPYTKRKAINMEGRPVFSIRRLD